MSEINEKKPFRVFDFDLIDPYEKYSKEVYWPVFQWEVLTPDVREDYLNAFERLFIETAAAENGLSEEFLVEELGIPRQLYRQICDTLKRENLLSNGKLTEIGEKVLSGKDYFFEEMEMAKAERRVLFQDALSGKIIPFFQTENVKTKEAEDGFIIPDKQASRTPQKTDITEGLKLYHTYVRNRASGRWNETEQERPVRMMKGGDHAKGSDSLGAVRVIGRYPPGGNHKCYVRCHLAVDPQDVTNQEPENIWSIVTPFGFACSDWMRDRLSEAMEDDPELRAKILEDVVKIRETMRGSVAFQNELRIPLFDRYPMIANDEKFNILRDRIKEFEYADYQITRGISIEDTWRTRLSNALDRIMKFHLERVTEKQSAEIGSWLHEHRITLKSDIRVLLSEYGLAYYEGPGGSSERSYVNNPNITYDNLLSIAGSGQKGNQSPYKKTMAIFMLLAVHVCGHKPWRRLIEKDAELYQKIGFADIRRNREASHDSDSVFKSLSEKERNMGRELLYELVSAYFEGDDPCEQWRENA